MFYKNHVVKFEQALTVVEALLQYVTVVLVNCNGFITIYATKAI